MTNGIEAGNTVETLKATPVEEAAELLGNKASVEPDVAENQDAEQDEEGYLDVEFEPESDFVPRSEFQALLDRIDRYNVGASHKI